MRGDETAARVELLRPLKAIAVVLAILVVIPGVDVIARIVVPMKVANAASASNPGLDAGYLTGGADAHASLGRIEAAAETGEADIPEAFAKEVGFLSGARDVRSSDSGVLIVGYVVPGVCSDVMGQVEGHMRSRGWTGVALGEVEGATFLKSDGSCTWALVTCSQVGEDTSVVVRCVVE